MRDDLGVGLCHELMAKFLEIRFYFAVVVKLAIHHDDNAFVLAIYWLIACAQVYDRKPSHSQRNGIVKPQPFRIRPAMHDPFAHRMQNRLALALRIIGSFEVDPTRNSAHRLESDLLAHRIDGFVLRFVIGAHEQFRKQSH